MSEPFLDQSALTVLALALAAAICWLAVRYNRLVDLRARCVCRFAEVERQLARRYVEAGRLADLARVYMSPERELQSALAHAREDALAAARSALGNPTDRGALHALAVAESALAGVFMRLALIVEDYDAIRASARMREIAQELIAIEREVAAACHEFNHAIDVYNSRMSRLPERLFARALGFIPCAALPITRPACYLRGVAAGQMAGAA